MPGPDGRAAAALETTALRSAETARAGPDEDREAFMRRNHHRLVTDAARAGFLQGDYSRRQRQLPRA